MVVTRNRYRTPMTPPVSAWARHLDAYACAEGLSVSGLFRLLRGAVALGPESRTAFRAYLVDREPSEADAKALAAIVGWPPVETEPVATDSKPAPDLATAFAALAAELLEWRTLDRDRIAGLETLTGNLASQLQTAQERVARLEQRVPRGKAG